jgi:hypothetical protein
MELALIAPVIAINQKELDRVTLAEEFKIGLTMYKPSEAV